MNALPVLALVPVLAGCSVTYIHLSGELSDALKTSEAADIKSTPNLSGSAASTADQTATSDATSTSSATARQSQEQRQTQRQRVQGDYRPAPLQAPPATRCEVPPHEPDRNPEPAEPPVGG